MAECRTKENRHWTTVVIQENASQFTGKYHKMENSTGKVTIRDLDCFYVSKDGEMRLSVDHKVGNDDKMKCLKIS